MRRVRATAIPVVHRVGRRLIGISSDHFKRITRLRKTSAGVLSTAAVAATLIELGLKQLESTGLNIKDEDED